jgi:hypothetical protein
MIEYEKVIQTYTSEKVSKVNCDKCGKEIDLKVRNEKYVKLTFGIGANRIFVDANYPHYQLCNDCGRIFYNWFDFKLDNDKYYKDDWDYYLDPEDDFEED